MIVVGTAYDTVADAKAAVTAVLLEAGLSYTAYKSDKTRLILKCRDERCSFHLRASYSKRLLKAVIAAYEPHVCSAETHYDFKERRRVKYLKTIHTAAILDDRFRTTPASIIFHERERRGNKIGYWPAYRVRKAVIQGVDGIESAAFALLPDLVARIRELSSKQLNSHDVKYSQHPTTNAFQAIAISPAPTIGSFQYLRPLIALDGTFVSGRYPMTLLTATALDANSQIVLLSFALVPSETYRWWSWFLLHLSDAYNCRGNGINKEERHYVFISDRDKGLENAVADVFPAAFHGMCSFHLAQNVKTKYGAKAASYTHKLAKAKSEAEFLVVLEELRGISRAGAAYLEATDLTRWARHAFPYPRFGHTTSNIAESLNSTLKKARQLPPLQLINHIWIWIMSKRHERHNSVHNGVLANKPLKDYETRLALGSRFRMYPSGGDIYQVEDLTGKRFIVNLGEEEAACNCGGYKEYISPCSHMLCVMKEEDIDSNPWIAGEYTRNAYRNTYGEALYPLSIESLTPTPEVQAPEFHPQKGRPKTKRWRRGEWGAKKRVCGKCKRLCHHTARTCTSAASDLPVVEVEEAGGDNGDEEGQEEENQEQEEEEMDVEAEIEDVVVVGERLVEGPGWYYVQEVDPGPGFHERPVEILPSRSRRAARG